MARVATIVAARLDVDESIAVESAHWDAALAALGFEVRRAAGTFGGSHHGPRHADDVTIRGLDATSGEPAPSAATIAAALDGSDLVVVENLASLPSPAPVSAAVVGGLRQLQRHGTRVVLHHHDLPSQRRDRNDGNAEFPARLDGALHVATSQRSRRELLALGCAPVAFVNPHVDLDAPAGDRSTTRAAFGFPDEAVVLLVPARAAERKNIPGAVRFVQALAGIVAVDRLRLWITGPVDAQYAATLDRVIAKCPCPVTVGRAATAADAYAACDAVLVPSAWERFGRAPLEAVVARRPCVVGSYPVLGELEAGGLRFFAADEPAELVKYLARPVPQFHAVNTRRARVNFSIEQLPERIGAALALLPDPLPSPTGTDPCT